MVKYIEKIWKDKMWYFYISPAFILILVFLFYPVAESFRLSFFLSDLNYEEFVKLDNYKYILTDAKFWKAVYNTFYMGFFHVVFGVISAIALAIVLNNIKIGKNIFRFVYFLPFVTTIVAISIIWSFMFDVDFGAFNFILTSLGLPKLKWVASPKTAKISIVMMTVWRGLGYRMIIALAGLQAIPSSLYEAAEIDGANRWQQIKSITLPLLKPTIAFLVVTSTIASFQRFDSVYLFGTELGFPSRSLSTITLYLYEHGFMYNQFGLASSAAYVLFILILIVTVLNLTVFKENNY